MYITYTYATIQVEEILNKVRYFTGFFLVRIHESRRK